jgi:molecular chaperone IbpA
MTNQLTLRSLDIPSIHKFAVGFDSLFDEMIRINAQQGGTNYPPFNIVQINEDEYVISLAVAGFGPDNIDVTKEGNYLVIDGVPVLPLEDINYLHKGISTRSFRREFKLADHVEIENCNLELGILSIKLKRTIPEEQKPKKIAINYNK